MNEDRVSQPDKSIPFEDVLNDPTPNGIILKRFVWTMINFFEKTDLKDEEKKEFQDLIIHVGRKLITVWKHQKEYESVEGKLIEKLLKNFNLKMQSKQ